MDAGALDVLEDAWDDDVLAVERCVDFDLGSRQVFVDQQRRVRQDRRSALGICRELRLVVHDLHASPAEHVRRPDQDRKPDLARDFARLAERQRGPARRARDAELGQHGIELLAILRQIERALIGAQHFDAARRQVAREIDRRLAPEGQQGAPCAGRAHGVLDLIDRRRLEYQDVGDIEVGRHGLRIVVDHDRRDA